MTTFVRQIYSKDFIIQTRLNRISQLALPISPI